MKQKTILCIDDNRDNCELVEFYFKERSYQVTSCNAARAGVLYARQEDFSAIILDNRFEDASGTEICAEIRGFDKTTPIVFFSGEARPMEIEKAFAAGANAYLVKPNDFDKLTSTVIGLAENSLPLEAAA